MIFEPIKPYVIWILLVIFLGPFALSMWRGTTDIDAQVAMIEAMDQLNQARMVTWEYPETEWGKALQALPQSQNQLTELYAVEPNILGVTFKDDILINDTLSGTQIEMLLDENTQQWICRPGQSAPPRHYLPANCGGNTHNLWRDFPLLIGICLLIIVIRFVVTYFVNDPVLRRLREDATSIKFLPLGSLPKIDSVLKLTRQLTSRLTDAQVKPYAWQQAVRFSGQKIDLRLSILARRFKLESNKKVVTEQVQGVLYHWEFSDDSALVLDRCQVFYPLKHCQGQALVDTLSRLSQTNTILIIIQPDEVDNQSLQDIVSDRKNVFVAPRTEELTAILLEPEPEPVLNRILARQLMLTRISPYQTRGGLTRTSRFFGREQELAKVLDRELSNYLVIGGRQLGKTSLLKELERRYSHRQDIQTYYLSLRDHRLTVRLAMIAEMDPDSSLSEVMSALSQRELGRKVLVMVDEADLFMRFEREHQYPTLQEIRSLSDEGLGYFIFAGFWDIYESAMYDYQSPIRNFGETIRIGALGYSACREMVVQPISQLGLSFASDDLIEDIVRAG